MIFGAIVGEHGLHLHVERTGRDYVLIAIVTAGDSVVGEHQAAIRFEGQPEEVRLLILLRMYLAEVLRDHERWRTRLHLGVAPISPANDG